MFHPFFFKLHNQHKLFNDKSNIEFRRKKGYLDPMLLRLFKNVKWVHVWFSKSSLNIESEDPVQFSLDLDLRTWKRIICFWLSIYGPVENNN